MIDDKLVLLHVAIGWRSFQDVNWEMLRDIGFDRAAAPLTIIYKYD